MISLRCYARGAAMMVAALLLGPGVVVSQTKPSAADWPQFLGPQRNGISTETGLIDTFAAEGPKELWRVQGGAGMSGLAVSQGRLVTLIQKDGKQWLAAFDADSGKELWQTSLAPAYSNAMGAGPRSTPTIAGDQVFALTGEGILVAANLSDGKVLWSQNVPEALGGRVAEYGMACSPLVLGERVIVTAGAPEAAVAAFNAADGKLAWKAGNDACGYSSPVMLKVGGREQLVAFTGGSVLGLNEETGEPLWRYPYATDFDCNIATPVAYQGKVFVSAGENHGSAMLELKPSGETFTVAEAWTSQGPQSVLRTEWQTALLLGDYLYGFDNVGGAGPISHLTCINAKTGERVWQQLRFGKGNAIAADGKLWITMYNGDLVLVKATPEKFKELARASLGIGTRQAPTLAGGKLYLRDDKQIVCLDVRK